MRRAPEDLGFGVRIYLLIRQPLLGIALEHHRVASLRGVEDVQPIVERVLQHAVLNRHQESLQLFRLDPQALVRTHVRKHGQCEVQ